MKGYTDDEEKTNLTTSASFLAYSLCLLSTLLQKQRLFLYHPAVQPNKNLLAKAIRLDGMKEAS